MMPSTPILVMTPESTALAGEGATGCAVGSHACMGNMPALTPKPTIITNAMTSVTALGAPESTPPAAKSETHASSRVRTSRSRADTASAFATMPAISPCSCCFFNCSIGRKRQKRLSASD